MHPKKSLIFQGTRLNPPLLTKERGKATFEGAKPLQSTPEKDLSYWGCNQGVLEG